MIMASRTAYSTWAPQKPTLFDGHYLRNRSTLDIGALGYIGIVQHKEHSPEVLSIPPGTPCILQPSEPWFHYPTNIQWAAQFVTIFFTWFSPSSSYVLLPSILFSTLFSNTLSLRPFLAVRDHVLHAYIKTGIRHCDSKRSRVTGNICLQTRIAAVNIMNKKSWTSAEVWFSSLGVRQKASNSSACH